MPRDMLQWAGIKLLAKPQRRLLSCPRPRGQPVHIPYAPPAGSLLFIGGDGHNEFRALVSHRRQPVDECRLLRFLLGGRVGGFFHSLRGFEQERVQGFGDGLNVAGFGGQAFKRAGFPLQNAPERRLAVRALRVGVNQLSILDPDVSHPPPGRDAQHARIAQRQFHLDCVQQICALHVPTADAVLLAQQRLDALQKHLRILLHVELQPEQIHAQRVGARAEFLVRKPRQRHRPQFGKPPPHKAQHLQPVHPRHPQIAQQQVERLRVEKRPRARAR